MSNLALILLIVVLLLLVGAVPVWPHSIAFGYGPSGALFVVLIVVLVLAVGGRL